MRVRRGSALVLVLLMTLAVAALAAAAIFMSSSAGLLSRFYDRERTFRLAAESALELARARLLADTTIVVRDTGIVQLLAGGTIRDAAGNEVPLVRVNVYAATTGDTLGVGTPHLTLLAQAYDDGGTRHVRRVDLARESFSRFALFADSFPSGSAQGIGTVMGRVHTNGTWRSGGATSVYRDTVSAVTGFSGTATFSGAAIGSTLPILLPNDSTLASLDASAEGADLAFTPLTSGNRRSRLEFVALDADGDGVVEPHEGFVRVFELAAGTGLDSSRLRGTPRVYFNDEYRYYRWDDPIIQKQCGASYFRGGRWHFFTVETHRAGWARDLLISDTWDDFPEVRDIPSDLGTMDDSTFRGAEAVLNQHSVRCHAAGSPFLLTSERFTNESGAVTGTSADTIPFGVVAAGGRYGGSDTTFTARSRTCPLRNVQYAHAASGHCVHPDSVRDLGAWKPFEGTAVSGVPTTVRQEAELPFLWPFSRALNPDSRGVVLARGGPLYVSGTVRGPVTLRVAGAASITGRLAYQREPNDPSHAPCEDSFGLIAQGDVLVVEGLMTRVRRIAHPALPNQQTTLLLGGEGRFTLHGSVLSTRGTVGAENPDSLMGLNGYQLPCPEDGGVSSTTNGGCFAITGGMAMRRFSAATALAGAPDQTGYRYFGNADRCQQTTGRPPFFPLTNRFRLIRTVEIEPSQANSPAKIRALLLRLRGRPL